jgi:riboflavin-specific deaminase-like protein
MQFRQLLPAPAAVQLPELLDSLELRAQVPAQRPFTIANFITSVDGRATFQGRSGRLGDDGDRALFRGLRDQADCVLVGTGTLRAEHYGRLIHDPDRRRRRAERGLDPEPLACIVSRSGEVPIDVPLFAEPEARAVVFAAAPVDTGNVAARVDVVRLAPGALTLATVLARLRTDYSIRVLLCEGGPTLFGALVRAGVVDELFLTLASKLTGGGDGETLTHGPEVAELDQLTLLWALERAGSLFLRYALPAR